MKEFLNILSIAIALSMDTFSLSLSLGTYNISYKKISNCFYSRLNAFSNAFVW